MTTLLPLAIGALGAIFIFALWGGNGYRKMHGDAWED